MTSVLSNCFSDPKYGIRRRTEIHHDEQVYGKDLVEGNEDEEIEPIVETQDLTYAYIYLDGDVFFRLNLTAPYWGTISEISRVPPPHAHPEGRGDAVDWAIFMLILVGTLFGFLVMFHQVGIVLDKRLRFRYFFHPTMTEEDWASDDEWGSGSVGEQSPLKGGGFAHSELRMTVESIPTSMGGGGTNVSPPKYRDDPEDVLVETSEHSNGIDLEMAQLKSPMKISGSNRTTPSSSPMKVSFGDDGTPTNELPLSLRLKRDTPDHVERPTSRSFSKVAIPKQSPRTDDLLDARSIKFGKDQVPPELPLDDDSPAIT